jgi:hypothetical protein
MGASRSHLAAQVCSLCRKSEYVVGDILPYTVATRTCALPALVKFQAPPQRPACCAAACHDELSLPACRGGSCCAGCPGVGGREGLARGVSGSAGGSA